MNITEKAILVKLGIKSVGNSKTDKTVTQTTIEREGMQSGAGKWKKQLWPDEALKPLIQKQGVIRTYHYDNTLPWDDDGRRILPLTNHEQYTSAMRVFRADWEKVTAAFVAQFDQWLNWACVAHNGAFDRKNYPKDAGHLARKFALDLAFDPVPSADDFRVALTDEEMTLMRSDLDQRVSDAVSAAQNDIWRRLAEPLAKMVERLSDEKATFKNSLVNNIAEIVALIPRLNLTGDSALQSFADLVGEKLATLEPDHLRKDLGARKQAAEQARAITERMAGYFTPVETNA